MISENSFFRKNLCKICEKGGSALIITMLVITVIAAMGFSVSRLTISQMRQTTQLEDSVMAYYAAESGIETGLLMWKFNQDVEVPVENMSEDILKSWRVTINGMITDPSTDFTIPPTDRTSSIFDLRIWYKKEADEYGKVYDFDDITDESNPVLKKDDVIELRGLNNLNDFDIKFDDQDCNRSSDREIKCAVEIKRFDGDGNLILGDYLNPNPIVLDQTRITWPRDIPISNLSSVRIRAMDVSPHYAFDISSSDSANPKIDIGYTYIESTGYYGNAKRRLLIKINRASGTISGPYDMVIYQGE